MPVVGLVRYLVKSFDIKFYLKRRVLVLIIKETVCFQLYFRFIEMFYY